MRTRQHLLPTHMHNRLVHIPLCSNRLPKGANRCLFPLVNAVPMMIRGRVHPFGEEGSQGVDNLRSESRQHRLRTLWGLPLSHPTKRLGERRPLWPKSA